MLTCLASQSTSPTFVTFPPQVLSTGERGARLWFPFTWLVRQLLLLPVPPPLLQPHGIPWGIGMAGKHPYPPWSSWETPTSPWSPLLDGVTRCRSRDQEWLTLMLFSPLKSQPECPRCFEGISSSTKLGVKSQLLAKVWVLSYLKRPLGCWWVQCRHRKGWMGRMFSENSSAAVLMRWIQPSIREHPLRHPFVPNVGVGVLWTAGVLGTGVQVAIFYRGGHNSIPQKFLWTDSNQPKSFVGHNIHKGWLLLKKKNCQMIYIVSLQASFPVFSPKIEKKKNKEKEEIK